VLAIRTKLYGEKDWRVTDARLELEQTIRLSQLDAAQRRELANAIALKQEVDRLKQKGQYGKAAQLAENVLAIRKKVLGDEHADYADTQNDLAVLYYSQGDFAKIFRHLKKHLSEPSSRKNSHEFQKSQNSLQCRLINRQVHWRP
jgi:tetratricopeptide (TPR) repeat protein